MLPKISYPQNGKKLISLLKWLWWRFLLHSPMGWTPLHLYKSTPIDPDSHFHVQRGQCFWIIAAIWINFAHITYHQATFSNYKKWFLSCARMHSIVCKPWYWLRRESFTAWPQMTFLGIKHIELLTWSPQSVFILPPDSQIGMLNTYMKIGHDLVMY